MSPLNYQLFYERHLPHYQPLGATLFITFRLADSLPQEVLQRLKEETERRKAKLLQFDKQDLARQSAYETQKQLFGIYDAELDASPKGPRWLSEPAVANIVCEAVHYRDSVEYILEAYCLMPNHVHLVIRPLSVNNEEIALAKILQSLKGYTARKANEVLGRQGSFWQHESYDHAVRDPEEFERIVQYVLENPVRAGLPARWVYRKKQG